MEIYVNKDTIVKNELYETFKDNISCPKCKELMIQPLMCLNCMTKFCNKCFEDIKQKGVCPNNCCELDFKEVKEINNDITKFKFKCIKGCGEEIPFKDIDKHYSKNCLDNSIHKIRLKTLTPQEAADYKSNAGNDIPKITSKIYYD